MERYFDRGRLEQRQHGQLGGRNRSRCAGNTADFSTINLPGDIAINVVDPRTIGNLVFGDTETLTTPASWLLSGNTFTLAGTAPTVTVNALGDGKSVTIGDVIAGTAGLTKAGPGASFSPPTTLSLAA